MLEEKPQLLKLEHILGAAKTGGVEAINKVFTKGFAQNAKINTKDIRDRALFELAQYAINNSKDNNKIDTNLFKVMSNLIDLIKRAIEEQKSSEWAEGTEKEKLDSLIQQLNEHAGQQQEVGANSKAGFEKSNDGIKSDAYSMLNGISMNNMYKDDRGLNSYNNLILAASKQTLPSMLNLSKQKDKVGYKPVLTEDKPSITAQAKPNKRQAPSYP